MFFGENTVEVACMCPFCGSTDVIVVRKKDYVAWDNGVLIQRAFPYLTANQRERLMTGICPDCWDNMFKGMGD